MVEMATLLSTADFYAVVELPGRELLGAVVQADSAHRKVAQLSRIQALAKNCGNAELGVEAEDICGLLAEMNRKFVSTCESQAIELQYPQNGRRVDTLERES
jgi:hypothetical protein